MTPKLSILVCSMLSRSPMFLEATIVLLEPQLNEFRDDIEFMVDIDNSAVSIGQKRQRMLNNASGEYVCWIDDDDLVAGDYCSSILEALKTSPDCVGFYVGRDNSHEKGYAKHSIEFTDYRDYMHEGERVWERMPNHLNPVKRELALKAGFPNMNFGEDKTYSFALRPHLNTEVFIPKVLYFYELRPLAERKYEITHDMRISGIAY